MKENYEAPKINQRIRILRTSLKLTMETFGNYLGVGKTAISKLENGERNVTDQMFKSICREFNVSEEWLRNGTGDIFLIPEDKTAAIVESILSNPDDPIYKTILSIAQTYEQLSPSSQQALRDFVDNWFENLKNMEK